MIDWTKLVLFLAVETFLFATASLVHAGIVLGGYEHSRATIAEGVISAVLALGLVSSLMRPAHAPVIALAVQTCALIATLVGAFTIEVGIGPQTHEDIIFHVVLLVVLVLGVVTAWRTWRRG